jgi:hypothetical protein
MDVEKILEMLEKEDKPFVPTKRPQVAKESIVRACNGDYDDINRLLEEDIAIDDRQYREAFTSKKITLKSSKESLEKKTAEECDATPVGVENPIPSPVRKRADEEDLSDKLLRELDKEADEASTEEAEQVVREVDGFVVVDDAGEVRNSFLTHEEAEDWLYPLDNAAKSRNFTIKPGKVKVIVLSDQKKSGAGEACAAESTTEKSPMKGTTDDIVKNKPIDFKSKNNGFETQVAPDTGKAYAMNEKQTQKAAGEELISTKDGSVFPEDIDFDEAAFADLFGLNVDDVSAMYVEEQDNIPEHIEIRFKEGDNEVLLKLMDDGTLVEEVNAEIVEEPRYTASIEQDDEGNFILLVSDAIDTVEGTMSEEDGVNQSEGDTDSEDEDGLGRTDEFVEGAGLDLDSEYSVAHDIKPAKNAADKIKEPTELPVKESVTRVNRNPKKR